MQYSSDGGGSRKVARRNGKIRCRKCDQTIESLHVHDFKRCKCGAVFIDGGSDYLRCGWTGGTFADNIEILVDPQEND